MKFLIEINTNFIIKNLRTDVVKNQKKKFSWYHLNNINIY